jgi:uncharacterized membrane protein
MKGKTSRSISVIAVMTAVCVATNYFLIGVANVKLMDTIVFITGLCFGSVVGASVGILTWMVYGTINPYGFSLPILIATSSSEAIYGILGGALSKSQLFELSEDNILLSNLKFGVIGFLSTFTYDLLTNIASAVTSGIPITVVLITGIPFALIHQVSNSVLFFFAVTPVVKQIYKLDFEGLHVK